MSKLQTNNICSSMGKLLHCSIFITMMLQYGGIAQISSPDSLYTRLNGITVARTPNLPFRLRYLPSHPVASAMPVGSIPRSIPSKDLKFRTNSSSVEKSSSTLSGKVQESWVRQYTSKSIPSQDLASAIASDSYGNIYITGVGQSTISGSDYVTVKYTPQGDTVWTRRYNGPMNAYDEATALGIDNSNNIYVTGYSDNGNSGFDVVTVKYRSDGTQEWVRTFSSASNGDDIPVSLVVTSDYFVYITGYSNNLETGNDVLTIKYTADGQEEWHRFFNGSANGDDRGTALVVDMAGNISVAGYCTENGSGIDLVVLQYNPDGTVLWSDRYSPGGDGIDVATALAIDRQGNVDITGYSYQSGTLYDCVTLQYDFLGVRQWVSRFDRGLAGNDIAYAIAVGSDNSIYVAGSSYGGSTADDYLTIKYNVDGSMVWKNIYNESTNRSDVATEIIVNSNSTDRKSVV
jgi:uncharacterized delta-60 repeat protein